MDQEMDGYNPHYVRNNTFAAFACSLLGVILLVMTCLPSTSGTTRGSLAITISLLLVLGIITGPGLLLFTGNATRDDVPRIVSASKIVAVFALLSILRFGVGLTFHI